MDKRYQVFISSTYADLKDERRAVTQAILEADCIPAGMELFSAADEDQLQFIKRVIYDCDYYLLIIGGRYGSVTSEGISYTEREYDYAVERGIPVLAFVHDAPGTIAFDKSEADPALRQKLVEFRERVKTGRLVKSWQEARSLPGDVALSLLKAIRNYPAIGWVRADKVANDEVLSDLNALRKRNEDLERRLHDMTPLLSNLADLDESYTLSGTYKVPQYGSFDWSLPVKWGELFSAVAPHIIGQPNDALMHTHFNVVIIGLYRGSTDKVRQDIRVNAENFQSAKVQFIALKLVKVEMMGTVNGGQALFWALTPLGHSTMMQLRTAKTGS